MAGTRHKGTDTTDLKMTVSEKSDVRPTHQTRPMNNLTVLAFDNATKAFRLRECTLLHTTVDTDREVQIRKFLEPYRT